MGFGLRHQTFLFAGEFLGYLGYEAGKALHNIHTQRDLHLFPAAQLYAYDWCVVQDHLLQRTVLVTQPMVSLSEAQ